MGACVEKEREDVAHEAPRQPPTCWARGRGREQHLDDLHSVEKEREERFRGEIDRLKKENRSLRERLASLAALQEESPQHTSSGLSHSSNSGKRALVNGFRKKKIEFGASTLVQDADVLAGTGASLDPQLLNSLIAAAWPFVSRWFENKMRHEVEPAIQAAMPAGIQIQFGDECHLGTAPMSIHDLVTTTYPQPGSLEGEDIENVRIVGELVYHGDCKLEATLPAGKVMLTALMITGAIVIELVRMVPQPPFFSGIRLYFPNAPEVNVEVTSEMLGVAISFAFLRGKIVQALASVITKSMVLPNRFAFTFAKDLDPFPLRHPRPQGVLRVSVLEVSKESNPVVTASVGAASWDTRPSSEDEPAVRDFVVMDWLAQVLRITVCDADSGLLGSQGHDFLGHVEVTVADLVDGQDGATPCERSLELEDDDDSGDEDLGYVRIQAQWRPLAPLCSLSSALLSNPEENCWALGQRSSAAWVLFVGVYSATMLPPAPDGTRHWVSVSVDDQNGNVSEAKTVMARSKAAVCKDIDALHKLGLSAHAVAEASNCDEARVERYLARPHETSGDESSSNVLVDVAWDAPLLLLLESVRSARLTATLWREGGSSCLGRLLSSSQTNGRQRAVGSVVRSLGELLQRPRFAAVEELPLEHCEDPFGAAASLRLRLQIRPLQPPPRASAQLHRRTRWQRTTLQKGLGHVHRPSVLARAVSKRATLYMNFHTPEPSDSEASGDDASG